MAKSKASKAPQSSTFSWEGTNKRGERTKGEMAGMNIAMVKAELRKQGITPIKVNKKATSFFTERKKKITQGDITIFARQLATMLSSGIALVQSFDIIAKGVSNPSMQELIYKIKADVEAGGTLNEAFSKHPLYFNFLFCNLVEAGEKSGALETMLDRLATYKEKVESVKNKIKKALMYPIAVVLIAFLVTAALLIFVVPQFESLFSGFGADLPAPTRFVVTLSEYFQSYWYIIFGSIGLAIYAFLQGLQRSKKFAENFDRALLKFPVVGGILEKAAIARFSRTLSITFAAGLPLVDALKSVAGATGNIVFQQATDKIRDNVSTGQQMQVSMRMTGVFPDMVVQMVAIGEEAGSLEAMLAKVADFYEEEVDDAVDGLSSLMEPLIMAFLGVIVGGLVVAMYLPIFKLGSVV